jgi:hypothetical protein
VKVAKVASEFIRQSLALDRGVQRRFNGLAKTNDYGLINNSLIVILAGRSVRNTMTSERMAESEYSLPASRF